MSLTHGRPGARPVQPPDKILRGMSPLDRQPGRWTYWSVAIVACLAHFMTIVDVTVVNVALPSMKSSLDLSIAGQQWACGATQPELGSIEPCPARGSGYPAASRSTRRSTSRLVWASGLISTLRSTRAASASAVTPEWRRAKESAPIRSRWPPAQRRALWPTWVAESFCLCTGPQWPSRLGRW